VTTRLTLHIVDTVTASGPRPDLVLGNRRLEAWFRDASDGELLISPRLHRLDYDTNECTGAILHRMTREVLPPASGAPVTDIALLFCGRWKLPADLVSRSLLGLMFDWTGDDLLGRFTTANGVPREACAIFLNEFEDLPEGERSDDIVWNSIHELGHVFNFVHDAAGRSFMAEGGRSRPGVNHGFRNDDSRALTLAANGLNPVYSKIYLPGGADFRGADSGSSRPVPAARKATTRWKLRAHLGKSTFLLGEPIVVDLALAPRSHAAWIEPAFDPGYDTFAIWYQTPAGETRRYHSTASFCRNRQARVHVTASRPLRNNPRVHVDRHGLVFTTPGVYRLWVTLRPARGAHVVRSNDVTFELRLPRGEEAQISELLRRTDVAKALMDGGGILSSRSRWQLTSTLRRHFKHEALASVRYQLAKRSVENRNYALAMEYLAGLRLRQPSLAQGARRLRRVLDAR
jgi:hypothetical protein